MSLQEMQKWNTINNGLKTNTLHMYFVDV